MLKRSPNQVTLVIIKQYFCIKVFLIHKFHPKPRSLWVSSFISELVLTGAEWQLSWQLTSSTYFFKYNLINNLQHQHGEKIQVALLKMHLFTTLSNQKKIIKVVKKLQFVLVFAASDSRRIRLSKADLDFAFFICSMTKRDYSYPSINI